MENESQELNSSPVETPISLDDLIKKHRMLDERVEELIETHILSPEETIELNRLKKEKLNLKDRIQFLSSKRESA